MSALRKLVFATVPFALAAQACSTTSPAPVTKPQAKPVATAKPVVAPTPVAKPAQTRPLFWRVDGKNGPSYLLGTMHFGVDPSKHLTPRIWTAVDKASAVVFEADLSDTKALAAALKPGPTPLDKQLSPVHWSKLLTIMGFAPSSMGANQLRRMPAWVVLTQLMVKALPTTPSMDGVLEKRAKKAGQRLVYLESMQTQINVVRTFLSAKVLAKTIDRWQEYRAETTKFLDLYKSGDAPTLAKAGTSGLVEDIGTAGLDALLYRRNRSWIAKLATLIDAGNAFVAVGALHLVGETSVIDLLRKRGYKITREPR